jgi:glycosyltransferase involved in cell wall biosynthesis
MPDDAPAREYSSRLTVVIPTKNEEKTIREMVTNAKDYAAEVIVIDGCSTDATRDEAQAAGATVYTECGRGKGDALKASILFISNEITVFMDADGSHDPADIPKLVEPILKGEADHVTGSRLLGGSSELHGGFDEFMRLMGSSFITACIGRRFRVRISDSQNGFRAIRTEVLRALDLREWITTIEQEMVIKTLKKGYRLAEVPAHEYKRRFGISHIRIGRVWFRYVYSMVKYLYF